MAKAKRESDAELVLDAHLTELGCKFEQEFRFHPVRKWRADYFVLNIQPPTLIEIEGAVWTQGKHTRGDGYSGDLEKYNTAAALGFRVFRFTTQQVLRGEAKEFLKKYL